MPFPVSLEAEEEQNPAYGPLQIPIFYLLDCCIMSETIAVIPAAGSGIRMGGDTPKQFLDLAGKPVLWHTLRTFFQVPFLSEIFLVASVDFQDRAEALANACRDECIENLRPFAAEDGPANPPGGARPDPVASGVPYVRVIPGGAERQDSVYNALRNLPGRCGWVMIHDGVRPFASPKLIEETWLAARETGASIAALPATDTIKRVLDRKVVETISRDEIWLVQTPQVFRKDVILEAYEQARSAGLAGTDDAFFVERLGHRIVTVKGEPTNLKVTAPGDLEWAEWYLSRRRF